MQSLVRASKLVFSYTTTEPRQGGSVVRLHLKECVDERIGASVAAVNPSLAYEQLVAAKHFQRSRCYGGSRGFLKNGLGRCHHHILPR